MADQKEKTRRYAFTLNNYTQDDLTQVPMCFEEKGWQYILGKEIGSEGTPHLQSYVEHKNPIRFDTLKKIIPRAHIKGATHSKKHNFHYCSKDGDYITNITDIKIKENDYKLEDYKKHLNETHVFYHNKAIEWILYEEWNYGLIYDNEGEEKSEKWKKWIDEAERSSKLIKVCKVCKVEIKEKLNERLKGIFDSDSE